MLPNESFHLFKVSTFPFEKSHHEICEKQNQRDEDRSSSSYWSNWIISALELLALPLGHLPLRGEAPRSGTLGNFFSLWPATFGSGSAGGRGRDSTATTWAWNSGPWLQCILCNHSMGDVELQHCLSPLALQHQAHKSKPSSEAASGKQMLDGFPLLESPLQQHQRALQVEWQWLKKILLLQPQLQILQAQLQMLWHLRSSRGEKNVWNHHPVHTWGFTQQSWWFEFLHQFFNNQDAQKADHPPWNSYSNNFETIDHGATSYIRMVWDELMVSYMNICHWNMMVEKKGTVDRINPAAVSVEYPTIYLDLLVWCFGK